MLPDMSKLAAHWLAGTRSAWPLFLIVVCVATIIGYQLAPRTLQPLPPPFAFTNSTSTIEASGAWKLPGDSVPNATGIFCWLPGNGCQLIVTELVPDGKRSQFKIVEKSLSIIQLSDATLTATSSSPDPCQVDTLRIDRKAQSATLSVGPSGASNCSGSTTFTAILGD